MINVGLFVLEDDLYLLQGHHRGPHQTTILVTTLDAWMPRLVVRVLAMIL